LSRQSLAAILPKYLISRIKTAEWETRLSSAWGKYAGMTGITAYTAYLSHCRKWVYYGATFFPACKTAPPEGFFELRTDHLWIAVNNDCVCIVDDDKHKVLWSGTYEEIEWECTIDSVTLEMVKNDKKLGSTLITPQAHLIDSLASRAIYLIEKAERQSAQQPLVKIGVMSGSNALLNAQNRQSELKPSGSSLSPSNDPPPGYLSPTPVPRSSSKQQLSPQR
jgi:hypothetical protein